MRFWLPIVLAFASGLLGSCGGGGGGGPITRTDIGVFTGFSGDLNWQTSGGDGPGNGGDGDGGAAAGGDLGQFRSALVVAKYPDGSLVGNGSALTDPKFGLVTIKPGKDYSGPLLVEIHGQQGATYYDEGKFIDIPFPPGTVLRVYVPSVTGNIGITPFTEAAYRMLVEGDTADRASGTPTKEQIQNANEKVRQIVNQQFPASVQVTDLTRLPILKSDTTQAGTLGVDPRGAYGLINGAFAKQAAMFNPTDPAPTLTAVQQLSEDLRDGVLDGMRSGQATADAGKRTYDPNTLAGELSSALAHQSFRYGTADAIGAMPPVTNFGNTRYETYLFDAKLTPSGQAVVTVAGWDGANDKNRSTGDAQQLLPTAARIQGVYGNLGHGALFLKVDSDDSTSKLYAVGDNTNGELGNGTRNATTAAVEVALPGSMTHIAGGFAHTVARLADGSVYAWGDNSYGQLGQGLSSAQLVRSETPRKVTLPRGAIAVAATNVASYALLDDGTVYSWGSGWGLGLLGDGSKDNVRLTPGPVSSTAGPLTGVVQIAARDNDAVVLRADGSVMTWGSFPADQSGGFTGGRQVATAINGLPDPATTRIRKVLTEQGVFVAQTTTGAVYTWGVYFDLTAQSILRDIDATQVLNLPPVRDIMPGGFLGYGERPFDRLTAMAVDKNGFNWKVRGRVAEFFDPADPTAQRRPKGQTPRPDCASCHGVLPTWPIVAPKPTSNAACVLPPFKLDASGRPLLVTSQTECTMCHNNSYLPFLNCVTQTLPAPVRSIPPLTTTPCQIPFTHVPTPPGTVCASCHNSVIAQPLACLPNNANDPSAPSTRATITAVTDDVAPQVGTVATGGLTNDTTPSIAGSLSAPLVSGQTVQILRNGSVVGTGTVNGTLFSFAETGLAQGTYGYAARVVQTTHFGPLGSTYVITVDTTAPGSGLRVATLNDDAGTVTGAIGAGATTDDSTPLLQGTLSGLLGAGESVRVFRGGVELGIAAVSGTSFSFAVPTLPDGANTLVVQVMDAAGNISAGTQTLNFVVNTSSSLPAGATTTITGYSDDVGLIQSTLAGSGTTTDDTTPTVRGTIGRALLSGERVLVFRTGTGATTTTQASVSGLSWSAPVQLAGDGPYTLSARIDNAGIGGPLSGSLSLTLDTIAPSVPLQGLAAVSDYRPFTGTIGSGVTNDNTPRIDITLGGSLGAGESFRVTRSVGGAAAAVRSVSPTTSNGTQYSFTDPIIEPGTAANTARAATFSTTPAVPAPVSPFTALTVDYTVQVIDAAGNQGTPLSLTRFSLNYPTCDPARVATGLSATSAHRSPNLAFGTCSSCHQNGSNGAGSVFLLVPQSAATRPQYWCRYP